MNVFDCVCGQWCTLWITNFHGDYENIELRKHFDDGMKGIRNNTNSYHCNGMTETLASIGR